MHTGKLRMLLVCVLAVAAAACDPTDTDDENGPCKPADGYTLVSVRQALIIATREGAPRTAGTVTVDGKAERVASEATICLAGNADRRVEKVELKGDAELVVHQRSQGTLTIDQLQAGALTLVLEPENRGGDLDVRAGTVGKLTLTSREDSEGNGAYRGRVNGDATVYGGGTGKLEVDRVCGGKVTINAVPPLEKEVIVHKGQASGLDIRVEGNARATYLGYVDDRSTTTIDTEKIDDDGRVTVADARPKPEIDGSDEHVEIGASKPQSACPK